MRCVITLQVVVLAAEADMAEHSAHATVQRHMPRRRTGTTTSVTIGGERFYLTANARQDGSLGEVFISWGKQGQTSAGLMDVYAGALSVGLQHGVPLLDLVRQGLDLYFVPNGHTDDPDLPRVRSVVDWVARRLSIDWLPHDVRGAEGIFTLDERVTAAGDWLAAETAKILTVQAQVPSADPAADPHAVMEAFRVDLAGGIGAPLRPVAEPGRHR
jgi:ribonucleoside-diphosphate reductase alpha chain